MIEIMLTQTFRVVCDRCGAPAETNRSLGWENDVPTARHEATALCGYVFSAWAEGGAVRELCLCPACHAATLAGGGTADAPVTVEGR